MIWTYLAVTLSASTGVTEPPRVFEKVRDDGVTVVCVRHDEKPTIFTSRIECKEPSEWRKTISYEQGGRTNPRPDFAYEFSSPKPAPRIVGQ